MGKTSSEPKADWQDLEDMELIGESAERTYLGYPGEEEEANDNFPAHEILQGCIWRDVESSQQKVGLFEEAVGFERRDDLDRRRVLDFSDSRRGMRGFLDDDAAPDCNDFGA